MEIVYSQLLLLKFPLEVQLKVKVWKAEMIDLVDFEWKEINKSHVKSFGVLWLMELKFAGSLKKKTAESNFDDKYWFEFHVNIVQQQHLLSFFSQNMDK